MQLVKNTPQPAFDWKALNNIKHLAEIGAYIADESPNDMDIGECTSALFDSIKRQADKLEDELQPLV